MTHTCKTCGKDETQVKFHKHSGTRSGLQYECTACGLESRAQRKRAATAAKRNPCRNFPFLLPPRKDKVLTRREEQ